MSAPEQATLDLSTIDARTPPTTVPPTLPYTLLYIFILRCLAKVHEKVCMMNESTTRPAPKPRPGATSSSANKGDDVAPTATTATPAAGPSALLLTGVPNLDRLLGGGIVRGSLAFISGPPGSGKTTLAAQIAFAAARAGQHVVILTALSEPTNKLIAHLRSFSFFDPALIGDTIQVISIQSFLTEGLDGLEDEIVRFIRQSRASLVIIDGFRGVAAVSKTALGVRQFLYSVGAKLNILGATTLITSEVNPHDSTYFPEATITDVIIGLHYTLDGVRSRRGVEIVKTRGTESLQGLHALQFSPDGLVTFPRLEVSVAQRHRQPADTIPAEPKTRRAGAVGAAGADKATGTDETDAIDETERERRTLSAPPAMFGLPALDDVLGGGLTRGTSTLVLGSPGTGKTLLGLSFVAAGARVGEPAVFVSFRESYAQLYMKAEPFNLANDLRRPLSPDNPTERVTLLRWAAVELDPDVVTFRLFETVDRVGARRLVIDGLSELENAITDKGDPRRVRSFTAALLEALRIRSVTSVFIKETGALGDIGGIRVDLANDASAVLAENMLLLRQIVYRGALRRVLGVLKMRFSAYDASLREFTITSPEGIVPLSPLEGDHGMLNVATDQASHTRSGAVGANALDAVDG